MSRIIPPGKLPFSLMEKLFSLLPPFHPRVRVKPGIGRDFTAIDMGDRFLVLKTDPITLTGKEIGRYLVYINSNDVVTSGARPLWLLVTALLPPGFTDREFEDMVREISQVCQEEGISLCGGHTEVTSAVKSPVLCGFLVGEVEKDKFLSPERIKVGDCVILTKGIAIEGTSIIAREKEAELREKIPSSLLERCKNFIYSPGISVVREAIIARDKGAHALHDPTEGGINTALYELGLSAGKGVEVEKERIPVFEETRVLAEYFGIDPYKLISSGALLIVSPPEKTEEIISALHKENIPASWIGKIIPQGFYYITPGGREVIEPSPEDELLKIFR